MSRGREVYRAQACWQCHTGSGGPALPGTERTGPDLAKEAPQRSRGWQMAHLFDPRALDPTSSMPRYPLFVPGANEDAVRQLIARYDASDRSRDDDGIVTRAEYVRAGGKEWPAVLARFDRGDEVISAADAAPRLSTDGRALLAYLDSLRKAAPRASRPVRIPRRPRRSAKQRAEAIERGSRTYARRCAGCHGTKGNGDGPVARFFGDERPRNFLRGEYRFKSTPAGNPPTDEDLYRTIRAGAGRSMPAWPSLSDNQVWDLVELLKSNHPRYVARELFVERGGKVVRAFLRWTDDELEREDLADAEGDDGSGADLEGGRVQRSHGRWWHGAKPITQGMNRGGLTFRYGAAVYGWMDGYDPDSVRIEIGKPPIAYTRASAEAGGAVYNELRCAECHGKTGRGDGPAAATSRGSLGQLVSVRAFQEGPQVLKGGADAASLVRSFMTGLSGTGMPAYAHNFRGMSSRAPWHLAHHVMSLAGIPDGDSAR